MLCGAQPRSVTTAFPKNKKLGLVEALLHLIKVHVLTSIWEIQSVISFHTKGRKWAINLEFIRTIKQRAGLNGLINCLGRSLGKTSVTTYT